MNQPFGSFELVRLLGRGGMAEAFVAHRTADETKHPLVLKRIRPDYARSEEYLKRFILEAQVASRLDHPSLARFREFGRVGRCHYLVMDMVRGWSLQRLLDPVFESDRPPPVPVALGIGKDLLDGLACMHSVTDDEGKPRPMLHRDVTPSNAILAQSGQTTLIDFGIAKDVMGPALTLPGRVIGTVRYMSPEHRRAEFIDPRADVFSASVILFELLTGRHPWPPLRSMKELLRTTFDSPELRDVERQRVSSRLWNVVFRGLACDPTERFEDAREMSAALVAASPARGSVAGKPEVARWARSLGIELDEELSSPVVDVASSTGVNEVMWTSTGGRTTPEVGSEDPSAPSEALTLPPLPPRREEALPNADDHTVKREALGPSGPARALWFVVATVAVLGAGWAVFLLGKS